LNFIDESLVHADYAQSQSKATADMMLEAQIAVEHVRLAESTGLTLFVVGSDAVWQSVAADFLRHMDSKASILRLAPAEECTLRTPQGMAGLLVDAMLAYRSGKEALQFVALGSAGLLAHELALQCLMRDVPLKFASVMEGALHDPVAPWRVDKGLTEHQGSMQDRIELHYFGQEPRAPFIASLHTLQIHRPQPQPEIGGMTVTDAAALQFAQVWAGVHEKAPATVASYQPLMTIQGGRQGAIPYFCIAGAGAGVFDFIPLATALGEQHPVHGLVSRGMIGDSLPHGSVESAAESYVEEIVRRHPLGGVHLVGHSFGGWIAFETALLLQARGYRVCSLLILDSEAPAISTRVGHEYTRTESLKSLVDLYEQAAGQSLNLGAESFEGLGSKEQLQLLHQHLIRVRLMPGNSSFTQLQGTIRSFEAAIRTRYRPATCFNGPAFLVQVRDTKESYEASLFRHHTMAREWRRMVPELDVLLGDGNHVTLLKAPNIGKVVHWLHGRNTSVKKVPPKRMVPQSADIYMPGNFSA